MDRRRFFRGGARLVFAGLALGPLVSCARATPVYNAERASFLGRAGLAERNRQIKRAGAGLGWAMEDIAPGLIRGTLNIRSHQAVVEIPYDQVRFNIRYASRTNLHYDGANIPSDYNNWVRRLEQQIVSQSAV